MSKKKTHEEYANEVKAKNPLIEVIGQYMGANVPIPHRCVIHDIVWDAYPSAVLKGHGCKYCGNDKLREQRIKSHQQYVDEVARLNPNIKVIEQYQGNEVNILHECLIDGYKWKVRPGNILQGKGCPKCSGRASRTHEEYVSMLRAINSNVQVIETYIDSRTKIKHRCLIDGHEWSVAPYSVLAGCGCPKCARNIKKTHAEYILDVAKINPNIEVVGEYINMRVPISHKCKTHQQEWDATPCSILAGYGCPKCRESSGERQVRQWLEKYDVTYIYQKIFDDCRDQRLLPFDFYLPDYNVCIEYDGIQHYRPIDFANKGDEWAEEQFKIVQLHDQIKNQYCKDNNIRLLRIPYFKNIDEELNNFLFI